MLSPSQRVFDEDAYAGYVDLLHRHGLSFALLQKLPGAAGPLFAVFHFALEPVTGLDPMLMRLTNFALLPVAIVLVARGLHLLNVADPWPIAAAMLVVPMTWVLAGMALTGMPALVFVAANLVAQLRGLVALEHGQRPLPWFALAGVLLGIAVLGRQTAAVLAVTPFLLVLVDRRLLGPIVVQAGLAALMGLPLLIAWHGPVPPLDDTEAGFAPENVLLSLGYLLAGFLLLARHSAWLLRWPSLAVGPALVLLNVRFEIALAFPLASIADNFVDDGAMHYYGII